MSDDTRWRIKIYLSENTWNLKYELGILGDVTFDIVVTRIDLLKCGFGLDTFVGITTLNHLSDYCSFDLLSL